MNMLYFGGGSFVCQMKITWRVAIMGVIFSLTFTNTQHNTHPTASIQYSDLDSDIHYNLMLYEWE